MKTPLDKRFPGSRRNHFHFLPKRSTLSARLTAVRELAENL